MNLKSIGAWFEQKNEIENRSKFQEAEIIATMTTLLASQKYTDCLTI